MNALRALQSPEEIEYNTKVGNKLRMACIESGTSQEQAGLVCGCSFQQIQKYMCGANRITPYRLAKIAKLTGKDISYFFEEENILPLHSAPMIKRQLYVVRKFQLLTSQGQQALLRLMDSMQQVGDE